MKNCPKCKLEKVEIEFSPSQYKNKYGRCKDCRSKDKKQQKENTPIKEKAICRTCNLEKEAIHFSTTELKNTNSQCKSCRSKDRKRQSEKRSIKEKAICFYCKIEKEAKDFSPSQLKEKNSKCKDCCAEYHKKQKENTPIKEKAICRTCLINKEAIYFSKSELKQTNSQCRDCCSEYHRQRMQISENKNKRNVSERKRWKTDSEYRIHKNISLIIRLAFQSQNFSKNGESCSKYLPWTFEELIAHIEVGFSHPLNLMPDGKVWMTFENQGVYNKNTWKNNDFRTHFWQLDHIIPRSDLPYKSMEDENFKKCWSLKNLRPLSAKQNVLDGVHRTRHKKK